MDVPPIHAAPAAGGGAALAAIARQALVLDERRELVLVATALLAEVVPLNREQLHAAIDRGAVPLAATPAHAALLAGAADLIACAAARYEREAALRCAALHDPLTGLANRVLLHDRLAATLAGRRGTRAPVAVLYLDLDGFKAINDTAGHETGDELLRHLARRMADVAGAGDVVARVGGDEFVVVTAGRSGQAVLALADRLTDALSRPVVLRGLCHGVGVSIGIAFAGTSDTPSSLVAAADAAMYDVKRRRGTTPLAAVADYVARAA